MAGGFGKRLKPITDDIPKPLIIVGGNPILYWQIKQLESQGIEKFVLLGGYKAGKIIDYINSIGYTEKFEFSIEPTSLGTAGAIKYAGHFIENEKEFVVVYGDVITDIDINRLKINEGHMAALSIVPYKSTKGIIKLSENRIESFEEKPFLKDFWCNAGITLLKNEILDILPEKGGLEADVFTKLAEQNKLSYTKFENEYFNAVDSHKDLEDIDRDLTSGKVKVPKSALKND